MITLDQLAEKHEVDHIPQYIYESFLNGAHSQVKELIKEVNQTSDYDDELLMITLTQHVFTGYEECQRFVDQYFNLVLKD